MPFGVTAAGFVKKTLQTIRAELEAAWKATFGESVNLHSSSRNAQLIGIQAEREAEIWDLAQAVYSSVDPDAATGAQLDNIAAITGTIRKAATKSTATVYAVGTAGTVLPTGRVVSVSGTGVKFETSQAYTLVAATPWTGNQTVAIGDIRSNAGNTYYATVAGMTSPAGGPTGNGSAIADGTAVWRYLGTGLGYVAMAMSAQETGPKTANAWTLTTIDTPVANWNNATNALDAVLGRNQETDAELRVRREDELRAGGKAALEAIRSAVLAVSGVTAVIVFENETMDTDSDGVPPKSVEVLVSGGEDGAIRAAIFASVAAGIGTHGNVSGTVTDSQGFNHTVKFSRPTVLSIYVRVDLVKDPATYPADGDDQVKTKIVEWGDAQKSGKDVVASGISAQAFKVAGVLDVTLVYIGTISPPVSSVTIPVALRQIADYDTGRITVNSSNGTP